MKSTPITTEQSKAQKDALCSEENAAMHTIYARGDRLMLFFILAHLCAALLLAPVYATWTVTLTVGLSAAVLFLTSMLLLPRTFLTRCIAGISLQMFVALHIYQLHGQPEMHFFFFTAFTMMIAYQDWRSMWPGALLIIGQHLLFAALTNSGINLFFFPESYITFTKLFFHFGIAIVQVSICGYWAVLLRRQTLFNARHLHTVQAAKTDMEQQTQELQEMQTALEEELEERQKTEVALRHSQERFEVAVQGSNDGLWDWDVLAGAAYFAPRWKNMLGYEDEEIVNHVDAWAGLLHPEDAERVSHYLGEYLAGQRENYEIEFRMRHKDGTFRTILARGAALRDADGKPYRMAGSHTDITERKEAETNLRLLSLMAEQSLNGLLITDAAQHILFANPAIERLSGYAFEEMRGKTPGMLFQGIETEPETRQRIRQALQEGRPVSADILNYHKDGSEYWVELHIGPVFDSANNLTHFVSVMNDITRRKRLEDCSLQQMIDLSTTRLELEHQQEELQEANARLEMLVTQDGLTGLKNVRYFHERLEEEFYTAQQQDQPLSLLILDVDHFKKYNDSFGHPAGDEALKAVAQAIQSSTRGSDVVARYGGEEFVVIMPETTQENALRLAERLRAKVEKIAGLQRVITVSVGVATYTQQTGTRAEFVREADSALYAAKQSGRNRVVHCTEIASIQRNAA